MEGGSPASASASATPAPVSSAKGRLKKKKKNAGQASKATATPKVTATPEITAAKPPVQPEIVPAAPPVSPSSTSHPSSQRAVDPRPAKRVKTVLPPGTKEHAHVPGPRPSSPSLTDATDDLRKAIARLGNLETVGPAVQHIAVVQAHLAESTELLTEATNRLCESRTILITSIYALMHIIEGNEREHQQKRTDAAAALSKFTLPSNVAANLAKLNLSSQAPESSSNESELSEDDPPSKKAASESDGYVPTEGELNTVDADEYEEEEVAEVEDNNENVAMDVDEDATDGNDTEDFA